MDLLRALIRENRQSYICCAAVHLIEVAQADERVRRALLESEIVFPDGAPVAWTARFVSRTSVERVSGSDVFSALVTDPGPPNRHFFYGSTHDTLDRMVDAVRAANPTVEIVGAYSPPFRDLTADEAISVAEMINGLRPDVVWVGLGAPKQELWCQRMRPLLGAPLIIAVGAVFDFVAGRKRRAPRVFQTLGLEWLYRLASEPRRLASRYLVTNTTFVLGVVGEIVAARRSGARAKPER